MTLKGNALEDMLRSMSRRIDQLERNTASGVRVDYAPAYQMTGAAHASPGNTNGWYVRINDLLIWRFFSVAGVVPGTGTMSLNAPFLIIEAAGRWELLRPPSTIARGDVEGNAASVLFSYPLSYPSGAKTFVSDTTPYALATGDEISGLVIARADPSRVAP